MTIAMHNLLIVYQFTVEGVASTNSLEIRFEVTCEFFIINIEIYNAVRDGAWVFGRLFRALVELELIIFHQELHGLSGIIDRFFLTK